MNAHCCFFFFFKQKTAYEISRDWSSDVCSSDLVSVHAWGLRPRGVLLQPKHSLQSMLPSVLNNVVGTPIRCDHFAAQYPACTYLYQRPAHTLRSEERRVGKESRSPDALSSQNMN